MFTQGWAKAPDANRTQPEEHEEITRRETRGQSASSWHVWEQVIIGEILNVLERRRYDSPAFR